MGKNVTVSPSDTGWKVFKEGQKRGTTYKTKTEAVAAGVEMGRKEKSELTIQRKDGAVQDKRSYISASRSAKR